MNDASPESLEIGLRYARGRGIPESHICHVYTATGGTVSTTAWSNEIRNPILDFTDASGLSNAIEYVVFAHAFPYRIWNTNIVAIPTNWLVASLTSSMYYDFYASSNAFAYGCNLNPFAQNSYYKSETAFSRAQSPGGRYLISALLTGYSADETRALIRRSAEADYTSPSGRIDLVRTSDGDRSVRWPLHEEADFRARIEGRKNQWEIRTFDPIPASTNRMGYHTGRANVPDIFAHSYAPGAYADHLTSYGGILDGGHAQTRILEWIKAGVAGSYGTVVEPCAYTQKFTDPLLYAWYERGFSLGEALYMSVEYPYQGLFVGDPLTAPYAAPAAVTLPGIADGDVVSGVVTIGVASFAADIEHPVDTLAIMVETREFVPVHSVGPIAGNRLHISLPDATATYEVQDGDTLFDCASGLAAAVNSTSTLVSAVARGDRVQLEWIPFGESATNQPIAAWAEQGTASNLFLMAWTPHSTFLDPTYAAYEVLSLSGNAVSGDHVVAVITLTNGVVITNIGFAETSMAALYLMLRLQGAINSNAALQGSDGVVASYLRNGYPQYTELVLAARTQGVAGLGLHVDYRIEKHPASTLSTNDAFQDYFNDNAHVMRPRALVKLAVGTTNLSGVFTLDTTAYPNGPLRIDAIAREGTAVRTESRATRWITVSNSPYRCEIAVPPRFHHVARGGTVTSIAEVAEGSGATTQMIFFIEGKYAGAVTNPPYEWVWPTTNTAIGPIHVQAIAYNDAGESARSPLQPVVIFTDNDGDGLSDQWEIDWFGSTTNVAAASDPDGDGFSNWEEFLAGTNPTDPNSYLRVTGLIEDPMDLVPRLTFSAVSTRVYRIEWVDGDLGGMWIIATGTVSGATGFLDWLDVPSNAPPAADAFRAYRVQTHLP